MVNTPDKLLSVLTIYATEQVTEHVLTIDRNMAQASYEIETWRSRANYATRSLVPAETPNDLKTWQGICVVFDKRY